MKKILLMAAMVLTLCGSANRASAYELQNLDNTPIENDFVLGPGKTDLVLEPGEKSVQQIAVTNRLGEDRDFTIEIEDFSGSYDEDQTVVLFGEAKGPYSLKDYIKPEITEFSLKHGERILIPVEVNIPDDSEAGGLYASVLVSTVPSTTETKASAGQTRIISRLGTLFFVRVAGDVNESAKLESFKVSDTKYGFYEKGPIPFEIALRNDGNIHIIPSGKIEITNLIGKKVGEVTVDKYFAMPDSLRERVVKWESASLLGKYTATLTLDKNYQQKPNESEKMAVSFWVIPWKILLVALVSLLVLWRLLKFMLGKFKFEIKKK
ncbi:MAG: hypothetical protein PHX30_05170 [Candidatus Pacebacteria bacterium]|nr:hypothetical protein [Candidatus Paceibacterota bacterium]